MKPETTVGEEKAVDGRRYSRSHEWVAFDGDIATVGVSQFAVEQMGDIVYLELGEPGQELRAGQVLGDIESVKAVSQLFTPVSGRVLEVNAELISRPELVNEAPLGEGWIVKMTVSDPAEVNGLMDEDGYQKFVAEQG